MEQRRETETDAAQEILVINPGSTTTKLAVYAGDGRTVVLETNTVHDPAALLRFAAVADQQAYRLDCVRQTLAEAAYDLTRLAAVVGRGGMVYDLEGGGYLVDARLCAAMASPEIPQHASSLGALLAYAVAEPLGIPAYIYDATMGCALWEEAKITGIAEVEKYGATHLLNSRAQLMHYAATVGRDYRTLRGIVCHMGGGITVNAWVDGAVVDVASYDDGPMAPDRSGGVPLLLYHRLCFDGAHTEEDMKQLIIGRGGLYSYLGTKDCQEVERRIAAGDERAAAVYRGMALQIAKAIAGLSCTLEGRTDVIILTGGIAYSKMLTDQIRTYCSHIGPVLVQPGEREMEALAGGALRMLRGEEQARQYGGVYG